GQGPATAADVDWKLRVVAGAYEVDHVAARLYGLEVGLKGNVASGPERHADMVVKARGELADAFRTAGLPPPLPEIPADRQGAVSLDLAIRGPLQDPAALVVEPRLRFSPEPGVVRALAYLREGFVH